MSNLSPKLRNIQRMDIGGEATFSVEASAYDYLRAFPIDPSTLDPASIRDEHARQYDYEAAMVIGAYRGTLSTTHYLHGHNSSIPSAAVTLTSSELAGATAFHHIVNVLGSALGNAKAGAYEGSVTVGATGAPVDTITVTDAGNGLANWAVGEAIAWATGQTNLPYYMTWLTAKNVAATPDTGTLMQTTPPFDPQGTVVWGGYNIWMPATATMDAYHAGATKSFSIKLLGHDADDQIKCYGCQPIGVKLRFPIGQLPTIEITWGVAHWEEVGSGGTPSVGTYAFPNPEARKFGWHAMGATASNGSGGVNLLLGDLEVDFGITRNEAPSGEGGSGVGGWFTAKRTPEVTFQLYRDYSEEITLWENQTGVKFTFQHGTQPGKMFGLCLPNARVAEWPSYADGNDAVMSNVKLIPNLYTGDAGDSEGDGKVYNSAMRLAFV